MIYTLYVIENGKLISCDDKDFNSKPDKKYVGILTEQITPDYAKHIHIDANRLKYFIQNKNPRFESRESIDIICMPIIDLSKAKKSSDPIHMIISHNCLLFICNDILHVEKALENIAHNENISENIGKIVYLFLEHAVQKDTAYLDKLEESISVLEDDLLINKKKKDYNHSIVHLHKRLLIIKRYCEQLLDIFEWIDSNENDHFDAGTERLFRILASKVDRIYHSALSLRDYVTQIREAYQAEVDISNNITMKIFTVVSTIFLPLSLIASWYGMNFDMPEYHSNYGYPIVIGISVLIVGGCFYYFKKHKWF